MDFSGLQLAVPPEFEKAEASLTLVAPVPDFAAPMMNRQLPIQPNLIAHRRTLQHPQPLDAIVKQTEFDLRQSFGDLENIKIADFVFGDNPQGSLLSFNFPDRKGITIAQLIAFRLDDDVLTTLTLTFNARGAADPQRAAHLETLAKTRVENKL